MEIGCVAYSLLLFATAAFSLWGGRACPMRWAQAYGQPSWPSAAYRAARHYDDHDSRLPGSTEAANQGGDGIETDMEWRETLGWQRDSHVIKIECAC